jgi:hypothetical protein
MSVVDLFWPFSIGLLSLRVGYYFPALFYHKLPLNIYSVPSRREGCKQAVTLRK